MKTRTEKYTAKKVYKGYVSVRSPVVNYCIDKEKDLLITYKRQSMLVKNTDLNKYMCDDRTYVAEKSDKYMTKGTYYQLYDYHWLPKSISQKPPEVQITMTVEGAQMLLKAFRESLQTKI